jgi:hypothetical protein
MIEPIKAWPLQWPAGWRTSETRKRAAFKNYKNPLSVIAGLERVLYELERLGVARDDCVISTNLRLRLDGLPRSDQAEPAEPGAAVYWRGERRGAGTAAAKCMAIDIYDRVADNLGAIAATLEAIRAIERHGGGAILDRVFQGFTALPAPEQWFQVLGVSSHANAHQIREAWQRLAAEHHPDRGGDTHHMARINSARDAGLEALQR